MKNVACILMAALAVGGTLAGTPGAAANHDDCLGNTHALTGTVFDSVSPFDVDHWALTVDDAANIVTLQPTNGDADLRVYDPTCTVLICSSVAGGTATDRCAVPAGAYQVRVYYFSSTAGYVDYSLRASPTGLVGEEASPTLSKEA